MLRVSELGHVGLVGDVIELEHEGLDGHVVVTSTISLSADIIHEFNVMVTAKLGIEGHLQGWNFTLIYNDFHYRCLSRNNVGV